MVCVGMKRDLERDKFIEALNVVCGECICRSEKRCDKCPVRITMDRKS